MDDLAKRVAQRAKTAAGPDKAAMMDLAEFYLKRLGYDAATVRGYAKDMADAFWHTVGARMSRPNGVLHDIEVFESMEAERTEDRYPSRYAEEK